MTTSASGPRETTVEKRAAGLGPGDRLGRTVVVQVVPSEPRHARKWWGKRYEVPRVKVVGIFASPISMSLNRESSTLHDADELLSVVPYEATESEPTS